MHEDDDELDMRTQEELMMQHRYMMVSVKADHGTLHSALSVLLMVMVMVMVMVTVES